MYSPAGPYLACSGAGGHAVTLMPGTSDRGVLGRAVRRHGMGGRSPRAQVRLTPEGLGPIEGVVDYLSPVALGVRTEDGLYRFARGTDDMVAVGHHLYAGDADEAEAERVWLAWLGRVFDTSQ